MTLQLVEAPRSTRAADVALALAAASGDGTAATALVERLFESLRATVHMLVSNTADAEDATQAALIEVLGAARSFRGESRLETWAHRIAVRVALRAAKKERRWWQRMREPTEVARVEPRAEHDLLRAEVRRHLAVALERLPMRRRLPLVLKLVHSYSVTEIAAITETPANTVRSRLRAGRAELREALLGDPIVRDWAREAPWT